MECANPYHDFVKETSKYRKEQFLSNNVGIVLQYDVGRYLVFSLLCTCAQQYNRPKRLYRVIVILRVVKIFFFRMLHGIVFLPKINFMESVIKVSDFQFADELDIYFQAVLNLQIFLCKHDIQVMAIKRLGGYTQQDASNL